MSTMKRLKQFSMLICIKLTVKYLTMELNEYQEKAMTTCMPSSNNFSYMFLNLVGEVGELASKVAKAIRKTKYSIELNDLDFVWDKADKTEEIEACQMEQELQKEAGDILWQLSGLCSVMGWKLEDIGQQNLDKLASRKKRNVIEGDGDNR